MRKIVLFPLMLLLAMTATACDSGSPDTDNPGTEQSGNNGEDNNDDDKDNSGSNNRYLVLFTSRSGNTARMAQTIQTLLDCDIVEVAPTTPYEEDYNTMLQRAQQEQAAIEQGNYPAINTSIDNLEQYDIIFIGYPIWYGHMATPIQTFLHNHADKLKGKRIALFASSGSSGISTSVTEARRLCPDATFTETLLLTSGSLSQMQTRITAWLEQIQAKYPNNNNPENNPRMINIKIGDKTITATMEDNTAARDFLSRLPLEVILNDFNNAEKIFYPSPALDVVNTPRGCAPEPGDITIYTPWNNIAIFYKKWSHSNDLIKIGRIDGSGVEALNVSGDIRVRFEKKEIPK